MEEPQHWPTERMIADGHADYATFEDLEGLDEGVLVDIAQLCEVDSFEPDECVPCRAHVIVLERREAAENDAFKGELDRLHEDAEANAAWGASLEREANHIAADTDHPFPRLEKLVREQPPFLPDPPPSEEPVVERFAWKVKELNDLVSELLEGPPIPPPNVTLPELGALVVGAKKWLAMIDAQGLELAPGQESVRQEIARVVKKVQRGE